MKSHSEEVIATLDPTPDWAHNPSKPRIEFVHDDLGSHFYHDHRCQVYGNHTASYDPLNDVFYPSYLAHENGWRLVRAYSWFGRFILDNFFERRARFK